MNQTIFIPIGVDCSVTHYLRLKKMRVQAFPFDWNVTPIGSAISLIQNGFTDFIEEQNLTFLPPTKRMLFEENGIDLNVVDEIITPMICKKYKILFPHDFSAAGKKDLSAVKQKYERRIQRLIKLLNESENILFVFNSQPINEWQLAQYHSSGINFPQKEIKGLEMELKPLKRYYRNIDFISLESLKSRVNRQEFLKSPIKKIWTKVKNNKTFAERMTMCVPAGSPKSLLKPGKK